MYYTIVIDEGRQQVRIGYVYFDKKAAVRVTKRLLQDNETYITLNTRRCYCRQFRDFLGKHGCPEEMKSIVMHSIYCRINRIIDYMIAESN